MKMRTGGSALFLTELLFALVFFSVAAAAGLRLFSAASLMNDRSLELTRAAAEAQSIADCYKAAGGDLEKTAELLGIQPSILRLNIYYDSNWNRMLYGDSYTALLVPSGIMEGAKTARLTVTKGEDELFVLDINTVGGE